MTSLTEMSIVLKKSFFWFIAVIIGYFILSYFISMIGSNLKKKQEVVVIPPDVRFNKITAPSFPKAIKSTSGMQIILENIEGRPPETTSSAKIYSIPKKLPTLLTTQRAQRLASSLGFNQNFQEISSLNYLYLDPKENLRTLQLEAVNLNFKLKYDYLQNPKIISPNPILDKNQALNDVTNYIRSKGLFDESVLRGKTVSEYLVFDNQNLAFSKAPKPNMATAVRVNFFREDIGKMKVLPPEFNRSFNYALYTQSNQFGNIIELNYSFHPIAFDDYATYPLRNSVTAWKNLVDGYAYVINMGTNQNDKTIVIRNIYLAYYDSEESVRFLQPIFVFEGDNDFIAYLPAITPEWLE